MSINLNPKRIIGTISSGLKYLRQDGTWVDIPVATQAVAGQMSTSDKTKLDNIATEANKYIHPTGDGNAHVPVDGGTNNNKVLKATSTAGAPAWGSVAYSELSGVPSTFTPSAHSHDSSAAGTLALKVSNSAATPTANLQEFYVSTDTFPRLAIDKDGKFTWGTGLVAGDVSLYKSGASLKTDNNLQASNGVWAPSINNLTTFTNSRLQLTATGAVIDTSSAAANVVLKVTHGHASASGNLTEWVKISTTVAKVDVNGNADFNTVRAGNAALNTSATLAVKGADSSAATRGFRLENSGNSHYVDMYNDGSVKSSGKINSVAGLQENGTDLTAKYRQVANPIAMVDMAGGTMLAVTDIPESEKVKLSLDSNWTDITYTGSPVFGTFQGQHFSDDKYQYLCLEENLWVRNLTLPKSIPFTTSIPFDNRRGYDINWIITGATAFTKNATGFLSGVKVTGWITSDGVNKPTFSSDFIIVSDTWSNVASALNRIVFESMPNGKIMVELKSIQ